MVDNQFSTLYILGVAFSKMTMQESLLFFEKRLDKEIPTHIVTANPEIVMYGNHHPDYLQLLQKVDIVIPDGIGVLIASKKWGKAAIPERVAGFDLLLELMKVANEKGSKVFLLGADEEVNEASFKRLEEDYPNAKLVGRYNGFFKKNEEEHVLNRIMETKPDILFVALGFPKQEEWIAIHKDTLHIPIMMGVGGSFDVLAGKVKRAPLIWQKIGLEWLYRVLQEPRRWKRVLVLPLFLIKAFLLPKRYHKR